MPKNFIETDLKNLLPFKQLDMVLEHIINVEQPPFRRFENFFYLNEKGICNAADSN